MEHSRKSTRAYSYSQRLPDNRALAGMEVTHTGWLTKKTTSAVNSQTARYFVLRGSTLSFYKSDKDIASKSRGDIDLKHALVKEEQTEGRFAITIITLLRKWTLKAPDKDQYDTWLKHLEAVSKKNGLNGASVDVGVIHKEHAELKEKLVEMTSLFAQLERENEKMFKTAFNDLQEALASKQNALADADKKNAKLQKRVSALEAEVQELRSQLENK
mmetsp:Transcript_17456/g.19437  ORF Transcript_17456/g.19437 Transcript_17456/m.19437 type:complete len:216 (-) Transcript_17456:121-768(-)